MAKFDLTNYKIQMEVYKALPDLGLIYLIENKINGKQYIGQTRRAFKTRLQQHTKGTSVLSKAINKYGIENFEYAILIKGKTQEELDRLEIEYIHYLNTKVPSGYNVADGGLISNEPWNKGKKLKPSWNSGKSCPQYSKPIIATNLATGEIKFFNNCRLRPIGFNSGHVTQCCKGRLKHHKNHTFRYATAEEIIKWRTSV